LATTYGEKRVLLAPAEADALVGAASGSRSTHWTWAIVAAD
jgi:hypothetical protein